jgi:hypothetical protein
MFFYGPDESILTEDEVRGRYTVIRSIKKCIDRNQKTIIVLL